MHQAYIEPHACVVSAEESGQVDLWINNKDPYALREQLAAVWGMDEERIVMHPCSIGGDFGGKGSFMDAPLCYYLSLHSGRPVKMVMDYITRADGRQSAAPGDHDHQERRETRRGRW